MKQVLPLWKSTGVFVDYVRRSTAIERPFAHWLIPAIVLIAINLFRFEMAISITHEEPEAQAKAIFTSD